MRSTHLAGGFLCRLLVTLAALVAAASVLSGSALAASVPPGAHYRGHTYGEWGAAWWNWAFSVPTAGSPLEGGPCDTNQTEKVFFLAGAGSPGAVTRSCTVPSGTPLFMPAFNTVCSPLTGDPEPLEGCAANIIDQVTSAEVTVDGRPVSVVQAISPRFQLTIAPGNAFFSPGTGPAVADGYWVLLPPLPPGQHVIHITSTSNPGPPTFGFGQDVTWNVTVRPGHAA
jgi:hypothetical protein